MHTCIVCTNSSPRTKHLNNVTYHSLPSNPIRKKKWIRSLKIKNVLDWHRVCSYHFKNDDYIVHEGFKRKLRKSAIPSPTICVTQDNNTKPEFLARLRSTLTVISELIYPEDARRYKLLKKALEETKQRVENTEQIEETGQTVEEKEQTVEEKEQTVEEKELTVEEKEQTVEEMEQIVEKTEVITTNLTENSAAIVPRRSTRKIKVKKNDDEIENSSLALSNKKKNDRDQTNATSKSQKRKNSSYSSGLGMKCYVKDCLNRYSKNTISFFGFPSDSAVRLIWIKNCGLCGVIRPTGKLKSSIRICREHFTEDMFLNPKTCKRLKPDAYPTLYLGADDENITSQSSLSDLEDNVDQLATNDDMESQENTMMDTNTDDQHLPNNINYLMTTNENVDENSIYTYCSIPGCNINEYTQEINSETLFRPGSEYRANKWSLVLGVRLTSTSPVCSRHFVITDTNDSENPSKANSSPILKAFKNASKRTITKDDNDDVTIKKTKNNYSDESKTTDNYRNEAFEYIENSSLPSNTKPHESFPNKTVLSSDAQSSNDKVRPKRKPIARIETYSGAGTPIYKYLGHHEIKPRPRSSHNDSLSITSSSDDSIPISLQSKFKEIISKSRPNNPGSVKFKKHLKTFPTNPDTSSEHIEESHLKVLHNNSMPNATEQSIYHSEQVSAIDSTKTINSAIDESYKSVSVKPEPVDDPSTSTATSVDKCPSLNSAEDLDPETLESSFNQTPEQKAITVSNIKIKSEPIDSVYDESQTNLSENYSTDNLPSNVESTHSTTSVNYMTDISPKNTNMSRKSTQTSTDCSNKVDSSFDLKSKLNTTPTGMLPSTSANDILANCESSKLKQLLLNAPSNGSLSITVHSGHRPNVSKAPANCSMVNTVQSNGQSSTNSEIVDQLRSSNSIILPEYINKEVSIIKPVLPNKHCIAHNIESVEKPKPVVLNYVSINSTKKSCQNNEYKCPGILLIHEIAKTARIPNNLWKHYFNIKNNATRFVELNESMDPIKNVTFSKSLVPDIYINGKSFVWYEEIRTVNQLENLLDKIDEIEICLGYDGLHHDQCIAYFEDTSEETDICQYCKILVDNNMPSDKSLADEIKELQKKVFEMEARVLNARNERDILKQKREKERGREGLGNILHAINPFKVLQTLKPPAYNN